MLTLTIIGIVSTLFWSKSTPHLYDHFAYDDSVVVALIHFIQIYYKFSLKIIFFSTREERMTWAMH